ncbi:phospholipase C/P1 nuclease [Desulfovibrio sp. X2]|uniref:zinc dependent phospholipase C family protein n=1 Tax=Desulfovibrio sp. X2 TaxID=941449 RepID=UPI00035884F5|nr:zinc dependent phospholipase C family protein [Desulfovibrio sp. X2]EPR43976.1 phospholipase C/P1 nuclease [Desulfovibrio sp. X2]
MPQELTHWLVARATAEALSGTAWEAPLAARPDVLLLGGVAHDALYYLPRWAPAACRRVPAVLGGQDGQDTHAVLRLAAGRFRAKPEPWLPAWLAGLATHVCADATFHPFIFWATGDYHHPDPALRTAAVQRHRALEALVSLHFLGGTSDGGGPGLARARSMSLGRRLRRARGVLPGIMRRGGLCEAAGVPEELRVPCQARAWRVFAGLQAAGRLPLLPEALYRARRFLPRGLREILALFFIPSMAAQLPRVQGGLAYRDPVTGEERRAGLDGLFAAAVGSAAELLRRMEPFVFGSAAWDLPPGLPLDGGTAGAMRHFAHPPLIEF